MPILILTALGFALGQTWDFLGLPSVRLGQADVLPAIVFALLLQPLTRFFPHRATERETRPGNSGSST